MNITISLENSPIRYLPTNINVLPINEKEDSIISEYGMSDKDVTITSLEKIYIFFLN